MDTNKLDSLLQWVKVLTEKTEINIESFSDGVLLLEILKLIDQDALIEGTSQDASERLNFLFTYLQGLYGDLRDLINKTAILAGEQFETAKLLTMVLVCAVNSENVHDFVEPVLTLPKPVQMNIMSIIEPINNRIQDADLHELLHDVLCNPVTGEESQLVKSLSSYICSPEQYSPYPSFVGSPAVFHLRNNSHSSSIGTESPFRIIGSPQIINRREQFEVNKLNVKLRRLTASVTTKDHLIDDLENGLVETNKKNEVLESINAELKCRIKKLNALQDEVDALRLVKVELESKQIDFQRTNQRIDDVSHENDALREELSQLKSYLKEQEDKIVNFQKMKERCDEASAKEHVLRVKCDELTASLAIKEEQLTQFSTEKTEQIKELSQCVKYLQDKIDNFENTKEKEDSFVVIEQSQGNLKNELLIVQLQQELQKSKDDVLASKDKIEESRKAVFELRNELNEKNSAHLSLSKEFESKVSNLEELKTIHSQESQKAKEREENLISKLSSMKTMKEETDANLIKHQDMNQTLMREKEELIISNDREKTRIERCLQDALMKVKSTELQFTNLNIAKEALEKQHKDQLTEHKRIVEKVEEMHQVECYKLKASFDKQLSEVQKQLDEKSAGYEEAAKSYEHLLKSKRSDDDIYLKRITALMEEKQTSVLAMQQDMDNKICELDEEKKDIEIRLKGEIEELKKVHEKEIESGRDLHRQEVECLGMEIDKLSADLTKLNEQHIPDIERQNEQYKLEIEQKNKEAKELSSEIASVRAEKDKMLNDMCRNHETERTGLKAVIKRIEDENKKYIEEIVEAKGTTAKIYQHNSELKHELEKLRNEKDLLAKQIAEVNGIVCKAEQENAELKRMLVTTKEERDILKTEVTEANDVISKHEYEKIQITKELEKSNEERSILRIQINEAREKICKEEEEKSAIRKSLEVLETEKNVFMKNLTEANEEVVKYRDANIELINKKEKMDKERELLTKQIAESERKVEELEAELNVLMKRLDAADGEVVKNKEANVELTYELKAMVEENSTFKKQIAKATETISKNDQEKIESRRKQEVLEEEKNVLMQHLDEANKEAVKHKDANTELASKLEKMNERESMFKKQLAEATKRISEDQQEKVELGSKLKTAEEEKKVLVAQAETANEMVIEHKQANIELTKKVDKMEKEGRALMTQIAEATDLAAIQKEQESQSKAKMNDAISTLESEKNELAEEFKALKQVNLELSNQVEKFESEVESEKIKFSDLEKNLELLTQNKDEEILTVTSTFNQQIEDLNKQCESVGKENELLKDELSKAKIDIDIEKSAAFQIENQRKIDENRISDLEKEKEDLVSAKLKLEEDVKECKQKKEEYLLKYEASEKEKKDLSDKLSYVTKCFETEKEKSEEDRKESKLVSLAYKSEIENLQKENRSLVESIVELEQQLCVAETENKEEKTRNETLRTEMESLVLSHANEVKRVYEQQEKILEEGRDLKAHNDELVKTLENRETLIDALEKDAESFAKEKKCEIQTLKEENNVLNLKIAEFDTSLMEAKSALVLSRKQADVMEEENQNLKAQILRDVNEQKQVIKEREEQLKEVEEKLQKANEELKLEKVRDAENKMAHASVLEEFEKEKKSILMQMESLGNENQHVKEQLTLKEGELEGEIRKLRVCREDIHSLETQHEAYVKEMQQEHEIIRKDREAIQNEFNTLTEEHLQVKEQMIAWKQKADEENEKVKKYEKNNESLIIKHKQKINEIKQQNEILCKLKDDMEEQLKLSKEETQRVKDELVSNEEDAKKELEDLKMKNEEVKLLAEQQKDKTDELEKSYEILAVEKKDIEKQFTLFKEKTRCVEEKLLSSEKTADEERGKQKLYEKEFQNLKLKHQEEIESLNKNKAWIFEEKANIEKQLEESRILIEKQNMQSEHQDKKLKAAQLLVEETLTNYDTQKEQLKNTESTYEHKIAEMKQESEKEITGLRTRLEETARDRSKIEAEKMEFRSLLADARKDIVKLLREKEEDEATIAQERKKFKQSMDTGNTELNSWKNRCEKYEENLKNAEAELKKVTEELEEEKMISRRHGSLLRSKEAELALSTRSLDDAKEQLDKKEKETETKSCTNRRLSCQTATDRTLCNASDMSFDEQSTLVADDVTMRKTTSQSSLGVKSEESFCGSITSLESTDSCDVTFLRSRSIRRQSGIIPAASRRRSLLYMSGKTPPDRRTTLGAPVIQAPICHMEDEPDILEHKNFDEDLHRMTEIRRRNTLCLPHLKSSYPLEVIKSVPFNDKQYENSLRGDVNDVRKRALNEMENVPLSKRKPTETSMSQKKGDSMRNVKSDSSIITKSMLDQGSKMIWGDLDSKMGEDSMQEVHNDPRRESIAFTVEFDDGKKKLKPNASLRRSRGSAHLVSDNNSNKKLLSETQNILKKKQDHVIKKNEAAHSGSAKKSKGTPVKRSVSDKTSLKSRTNNIRKSIRRSITSKVRGGKSEL